MNNKLPNQLSSLPYWDKCFDINPTHTMDFEKESILEEMISIDFELDPYVSPKPKMLEDLGKMLNLGYLCDTSSLDIEMENLFESDTFFDIEAPELPGCSNRRRSKFLVPPQLLGVVTSDVKQFMHISNKLFLKKKEQMENELTYKSTHNCKDEEYVEKKKKKKKTTIRRRKTVKSRSIKKRRKKNKYKKQRGNLQKDCCVIGCQNNVTNRLRFSLRCLKMKDFKVAHIQRGFDKVCHYHYFSDLYKYKKHQKQKKA